MRQLPRLQSSGVVIPISKINSWRSIVKLHRTENWSFARKNQPATQRKTRASEGGLPSGFGMFWGVPGCHHMISVTNWLGNGRSLPHWCSMLNVCDQRTSEASCGAHCGLLPGLLNHLNQPFNPPTPPSWRILQYTCIVSSCRVS